MRHQGRIRRVSTFLTARDADRLKVALTTQRDWGEWLTGFLWAHFATLTFRHQPAVPAAIRDFKVWVRRLEQRALERVYWFYALERGAAGMLHLHCLVSGTRELSGGSLEDAWSWGRADASPYDPERGASYYVTKAVASDAAEYDIDPPPRPRREPSGSGPLRGGIRHEVPRRAGTSWDTIKKEG